jgi:AAA15 family ATPase/GTPase
MKIRSLSIKNIKGIKALDLNDIGDMAIIAGPNGCGKSCIFDALKILKTSYGTYANQETNQLYNELGIKQNEKEGFSSIFRDNKESILVECTIEFSDKEIKTIDEILDETIRKDVFTSMRPKASSEEYLSLSLPQHQIEEFHRQVNKKTNAIKSKLSERIHHGRIEIPPKENPIVLESPVIEFVFSHYLPKAIGSIVHISANRSYQKQKISHINLSSINNNQQITHSILYDTNSLINMFHQDLASNFVYNLIKEKLGLEKNNEEHLENSIHELFEKFTELCSSRTSFFLA